VNFVIVLRLVYKSERIFGDFGATGYLTPGCVHVEESSGCESQADSKGWQLQPLSGWGNACSSVGDGGRGGIGLPWWGSCLANGGGATVPIILDVVLCVRM
jgi:hypothetical protein